MKSEIESFLIVDDDDDDYDFFKDALSEINAGLSLQVTKTGRELVSKIIALDEFPDIVLLDIHMPGISGLECLRDIRKNPLLKTLKVAIFSTSRNTKDIDLAFVYRANLYIVKPAGFRKLKEIILKIIVLDWENYVPQPDRKNFLWDDK